MDEKISVEKIITKNLTGVRQDFGDIDVLASSIKENGLIQPIRLSDDLKIIAGERRFRALKLLGVKELVHGEHFLWLEEKDPLRLKSIELEENIRRKSLTWQEEVKGKKQLLDIMQSLYGPPRQGRPTIGEQVGLTPKGFGVRTLASLLGENQALISKDLQIAKALEIAPDLIGGAETKKAALRKIDIAFHVLTMQKSAAVRASQQQPPKKWTLYEGDFKFNSHIVPDDSVDLVVTDLPFGAGLQGGPVHFPGVTSFDYSPDVDTVGEVLKNLDAIASETHRVLRNDRYCFFFFGFNFYGDLVSALQRVSFKVVLMPIVWSKNTMSGENPHKLYRHGYETILYALKGDARFMRQGRKDVMDHPAVLPKDKLMAPEKPISLLQEFIVDTTSPNALCLDWMAGSGSFGEACLKLNREVILFEQDPVACTMIKARLGAL